MAQDKDPKSKRNGLKGASAVEDEAPKPDEETILREGGTRLSPGPARQGTSGARLVLYAITTVIATFGIMFAGYIAADRWFAEPDRIAVIDAIQDCVTPTDPDGPGPEEPDDHPHTCYENSRARSAEVVAALLEGQEQQTRNFVDTLNILFQQIDPSLPCLEYPESVVEGSPPLPENPCVDGPASG